MNCRSTRTLREAGPQFDAPITRPSFWKSLSPMNYPIYSRRIWSRKERPSEADVEAMLDASRGDARRRRLREPALSPPLLCGRSTACSARIAERALKQTNCAS